MTGWEIKDIMKAQKEAHAGNSVEIDEFASNYPLCYVSADYSLFIMFRQFQVQLWKDERRILNCVPETYNGDKTSDALQWGITISKYNFEEGSGGSGSVCIPNYSYTGITCNERDEIIITSEQRTVASNRIELKRKLKSIYGIHSEQEILEAFNSLCNEQYEQPAPPPVVDTTLESTEIGTMQYDEEMKWYSGTTTISGKTVSVNLPLAETTVLKNMLKLMNTHLKSKFYEKAMQSMLENPMCVVLRHIS